jgi:hypothetical protein
MPYKDPERKRQWEYEHREERNTRRRKAVPVSAIDLLPNSMAVQSAGTGVNLALGVLAGVSLLLILLFARLRSRDFPKTSEGVQPGF